MSVPSPQVIHVGDSGMSVDVFTGATLERYNSDQATTLVKLDLPFDKWISVDNKILYGLAENDEVYKLCVTQRRVEKAPQAVSWAFQTSSRFIKVGGDGWYTHLLHDSLTFSYRSTAFQQEDAVMTHMPMTDSFDGRPYPILMSDGRTMLVLDGTIPAKCPRILLGGEQSIYWKSSVLPYDMSRSVQNKDMFSHKTTDPLVYWHLCNCVPTHRSSPPSVLYDRAISIPGKNDMFLCIGDSALYILDVRHPFDLRWYKTKYPMTATRYEFALDDRRGTNIYLISLDHEDDGVWTLRNIESICVDMEWSKP